MAYKPHLVTVEKPHIKTQTKKGNDMEFLKALFGEKALTYDELVQAINAHNGDEANKANQLKIANLGGGDYVSKLKYDDIVAQMAGKQTELDTANGLIAELEKGTKGNEELQGKITGYETQVADLQKELAETKVKSALKVALLSEKAVDIDYLTFKMEEKLKSQGKALELDENENIKGIEELLSGLKTQFPSQFESGTHKHIDENKLPDPNNNGGLTKNELLKKPYAERVALFEKDPEAFNAIMES